MNLQEIKAAVAAGKVVHWSNEGYTVKGDLIVHHSGNAIGLTWVDGVTLNGKECDFFIAAPYVVQVNHAVVLRTDSIEEVARYLAANGLEAHADLYAPFQYIPLTSGNAIVCGFVFNNDGN